MLFSVRNYIFVDKQNEMLFSVRNCLVVNKHKEMYLVNLIVYICLQTKGDVV